MYNKEREVTNMRTNEDNMITNDDIKEAMTLAIIEANKTMTEGVGGPFGAAVLSKEGNVIAVASNTVLGDNDPTAHAEVNAIRKACKFMGTHDLSGCILIATGHPCPMCLSAAIWANIKTVYYGCTPKDADEIGFRDDFIYDYIHDLCHEEEDEDILKLECVERHECLKLFHAYKVNKGRLY